MQNKLKTFLEEEKDTNSIDSIVSEKDVNKLTAFLKEVEKNYQFANNIVHSDSFVTTKIYDRNNNDYFTVKEYNNRLINFVLDIVKEEMEENKGKLLPGYRYQVCNDCAEQLITIINNLKVKSHEAKDK